MKKKFKNHITTLRRSTDRTQLCGSCNVGSIPAGGTSKNNLQVGSKNSYRENKMNPALELYLQELNSFFNSDVTLVSKHIGLGPFPVHEIENSGNKYAIKFEDPKTIQVILEFYKQYSDISLFPKIIHVSNNKKAFVTNFIEGKISSQDTIQKDVVLSIIKSVINNYKSNDKHVWGDLLNPTQLQDFILSIASERSKQIDEALHRKEFETIQRITKDLFGTFRSKPYLVHGDLGDHNIIIKEGKVVGIIDPWVILSIPLLELYFLVCSKPHSFSSEEITLFFTLIKEKTGFAESDALNLYRISLYQRIGTCIKHHPKHLLQYIKIYNKHFK